MNDSEKPHSALTPKQRNWMIAAGILILLVLGANWYLLVCKDDRGTFGDMFGVSSAIFTALAFAGVVYAAILQRNELKHQKQETADAKKESEKQDEVLKVQRFETTFFNMMQLQNEIVKIMQHNGQVGRMVFDDAYKSLFSILSKDNYETYNVSPIVGDAPYIGVIPKKAYKAKVLLINKYHDFYYNQYSTNFNHYFRNLYHIFKFIYFSDLDLTQKNFYASLCRAQLSQHELFTIAFNILIEGYGKPRFTYLVKEFRILKNFEWGSIQPEIYRVVIQEELDAITYPFKKRPRPIATNLDENDQPPKN